MNRSLILSELRSNWYAFLTPVFFFFSFPSFDYYPLRQGWICAWFTLAPLMVFVRGRSLASVYAWSFFFGLISNYLAFSWIGHFGASVPGGPLFLQSMLTPALSVIFALQFLLAEYFSRRCERLRIFIYPSVWICIEWFQTLGYITSPWTPLAYTQYKFTPFIQLAAFTGVNGITFILLLSNSIIAEVIGDLRKIEFSKVYSLRSARILILFIFMVTGYTFLSWITLPGERDIGRDKGLKLLLVQSCISPWENWVSNRDRYLTELIRLSKEAIDYNPDMIIWSESATLETLSYDYNRSRNNDFQRRLTSFVRETGKPLLTGEIGVKEEKRGFYVYRYPQNNAVIINPDGSIGDSYSKIKLVPFGEWFPYEKWLPVVKRIAMDFGASDFRPGEEEVLMPVKGMSFAPLVCYEGMFYSLCRSFRKKGADFFVNITNDGWTHTYSGHMQHFAVSVFRAIENGCWFVRAGNTGFSALIDPRGRVRESMPILVPGFLTGTIDPSEKRKTLYMHLGDWPILISALLILGVLIFCKKDAFNGNDKSKRGAVDLKK